MSRAVPFRIARRCAPLLISLLALGCAEKREPPARRVILITCDTLRADRLGVYGYDLPTSPRVDAFAKDAVVFEHGYSCAPWTSPALSSLMTGRLPDEIGVPGGNRYPLPAEAVTIAEVVRDAGLATGAVVSNWLIRKVASELGDAGLAQGFQSYDDRMSTPEKNREQNFERVSPDTTAAAIEWLSERRRLGEDRFFFWVHYQDPHGPYEPPAELIEMFDRPARPGPMLPVGENDSGYRQIPRYQALGDAHGVEHYRVRYDAEVRYFDQGFGDLIDWLGENGWLEDSLIVLSADHGESLGEHDFWFCHGENVYREVVRVPFVVRYPRGAAGPPTAEREGYRRSESVVSHLDLWPTILEALDLPATVNRGRSLFSADLEHDRVAISTLGQPQGASRWDGITDATHRCIIPARAPAQLYDIRVDPLEADDVAQSDTDRIKAMLERYRVYWKQHAGRVLQGRKQEADELSEQAMRKLGYTGE